MATDELIYHTVYNFCAPLSHHTQEWTPIPKAFGRLRGLSLHYGQFLVSTYPEKQSPRAGAFVALSNNFLAFVLPWALVQHFFHRLMNARCPSQVDLIRNHVIQWYVLLVFVYRRQRKELC